MVCPGCMPSGTSLEEFAATKKSLNFPLMDIFWIWEAKRTTMAPQKSRPCQLASTCTMKKKHTKHNTSRHQRRAVSVADQLIFFTFKDDVEGIPGLVWEHEPIASNDVLTAFLKGHHANFAGLFCWGILFPHVPAHPPKQKKCYQRKLQLATCINLQAAKPPPRFGTFKPSGRSTSTSFALDLALALAFRVDLLGQGCQISSESKFGRTIPLLKKY